MLSLTGNTDWIAVLRRVWEQALFGRTNGAPQIPLALNNEYITALSADGTTQINLIKADANNVPTLPAGSAVLPSASAALGGQFWGANFEPQSSTAGTNTAGVANQQWISSIFVPVTMTVTGVGYLIGTTGGTDRAVASIYSAAGALLGNSTTTSGGTTVGTGSTIQQLALTAPITLNGPASYLVSVQTNGTTAKIQTIPVGIALTGINSAGTTVPPSSITPPTQFNANQGVVCTLY